MMIMRRFLEFSVFLLYRLYSLTYRVQWINDHWVHKKPKTRGPVIIGHWHEDDLSLVAPNRFLNLYILISLSKDGDLLAGTMSRMGYRVVRGSSSRGGAKGLIQLIRAVRKGNDAILTVDGPRGPRRIVKPGIVALARKTGAPIVIVTAAAPHKWVFRKSWSQTFLAKPFTRVIVAFSESAIPPPDSDSEEDLESCRKRIEDELIRIHETINRF